MDINILLVTALTIGFVHTIIGPDHYLPFIMLRRARGWTMWKTMTITIICGIGHVLSSVVLGLIGVAFGFAVGMLEQVESVRGDIAGWLLIGLGVAYTAWGLRIGLRASEHTHEHSHNGEGHQHAHHHLGSHSHLHGNIASITPWALFIVFVLGPCEPLIPLLMYPAALGSWSDLVLVTIVFGVTTIGTMVGAVILFSTGLVKLDLGPLERYVHALAGAVIAVSGLAIKILGL